MALGNQAAALEELGRTKEALLDYQKAADLLKGAGEDEMRSLLLKRISTLQLRAKKPVEALFSMDAAVESSPRRSWSERLIRRLMALVKKNAGFS
jgi:predicted negative regulator of RcsB-dependent stress response